MTPPRPPRGAPARHGKAPRRGPSTLSSERRSKPPPARPAGFEARQAAVETLWRVMQRGQFLEDAFADALSKPARAGIEPRDRAFARLLATTVLRRHGELAQLVGACLERPLPERHGWLWQILLAGAAQLLLLETPAHAAIDLAVEQCKADPHARRFDKLTNAVLRRIALGGKAALEPLDAVTLNVPSWLRERWERAYGADLARRIAAASLEEPPLDLSVKSEPETWARTLQGVALPTGTVRLRDAGRVTDLPGFDRGDWWVQDVAAALPAKLLGVAPGQLAADLCAAPGGKTAQLAAAGARVTAVDVSPARMRRVEENLVRLHLDAQCVTADVAAWQPPALFDAVLLDAPCSATGTLRRHPDILHVRQSRGFDKLVELQSRLLARAADLVRPGGLLVYCTCSLEPEEGEHQIAGLLAARSDLVRVPVLAHEIGGLAEAITRDGDLRTLPCHRFPGDSSGAGMDGFYAARLRRRASHTA